MVFLVDHYYNIYGFFCQWFSLYCNHVFFILSTSVKYTNQYLKIYNLTIGKG